MAVKCQCARHWWIPEYFQWLIFMFYGSKMVSARAKAALDLNAEHMGTMNPLAAQTIVTQHSHSHTDTHTPLNGNSTRILQPHRIFNIWFVIFHKSIREKCSCLSEQHRCIWMLIVCKPIFDYRGRRIFDSRVKWIEYRVKTLWAVKANGCICLLRQWQWIGDTMAIALSIHMHFEFKTTRPKCPR